MSNKPENEKEEKETEITEKTEAPEESGKKQEAEEQPSAENKEKSEKKETTKEQKEQEEDPRDKEIASLKDQLLRNMAEYDNYRKRTSRERMELEPDITAKIVAEFLPIMDNVERALSTQCSDENFKKGIEMIYKSFQDTLEKLGVEEIKTEGESFDPSIHQAVQQVPDSGKESGMIVSTFQKGYKIGNKILRFAMVAVAA